MLGPRLPVRKIRDVLRLSAAGMSKRQIAVSLGVSATAARDCILRAQRAGLTWPLPEGRTRLWRIGFIRRLRSPARNVDRGRTGRRYTASCAGPG